MDKVKMKITKRQLRRIIREETIQLMEQPDIPDIMGAMGGGKFQPRESEIDADMKRLLGILQEAEVEADKIHQKASSDVEYSQRAGGREADDVELALSKVWQAFGGQSLSAEGFDV
jgi:hypothetical protein